MNLVQFFLEMFIGGKLKVILAGFVGKHDLKVASLIFEDKNKVWNRFIKQAFPIK